VIGKLDRRIIIERLTEGAVNGFNEPAETWATFIAVWAKRADVSDGEKVAGGQLGGAQVSRFTVRSSTKTRSVTGKDRLNYDGSIWNLTGAKETKLGRNRFIEFTAVRDSD